MRNKNDTSNVYIPESYQEIIEFQDHDKLRFRDDGAIQRQDHQRGIYKKPIHLQYGRTQKADIIQNARKITQTQTMRSSHL